MHEIQAHTKRKLAGSQTRGTKCLILAGGFATRLYPITVYKAKALLEYRGKPAITHIVERVPSDVGILVSTNRRFADDFVRWKETVDRPVELLVEEATSDEDKKGAIGSIEYWIRAQNIDEDLLVIAGDNYFEFDLSQMLAQFDGEHVLIAVYDAGDVRRLWAPGERCPFGLANIEQNRIKGFDEKPLEPTSSIVATGIYILPPRIYPLLSQYCSGSKRDNLGSFATFMLNTGEEVQAFPFTEAWIDIGDDIASRLTAGVVS